MSDSLSTTIIAVIPALLLVSALITLPISLLVLRHYRRAVIRSMGNTPEPPVQSGHSRPTELTEQQANHQPQPPQTERSLPGAVTHTGATYAHLAKAPWVQAATYGIGGIGYAAVMTLSLHLVDRMAFSPMRFLCVFWLYLWPAVITLNLVAASTRRIVMRSLLGYFTLLTLLGLLADSLSGAGFNWYEILMLWTFFNLPTTCFLLIFMHPKVRAVGPLIFTITVFVMVGCNLLWRDIETQNNDNFLRGIVYLAQGLGQNALLMFLVVLLAVAALIGGPLGWSVLQWIKRSYEQKRISDQSLLVTVIWVFFTLNNALGLATGGLGWILCSIPALGAFYGISIILQAKTHRRAIAHQPGKQLLLLRVFALGSRSEKLFRALSLHWRYLGSIQMIAGPDLVNTTIEPHEFLDFVTGKLARRFIDSEQTLQRRLEEMDVKRDRDYRYRVNDFFCYDNTWKLTLISLLKTSDAILMDLRSFTPDRSGCIFEINTLIDLVPLEKIVLLIDNTTDNAFLQDTLATAWQAKPTTSPNNNKALSQLTIFPLQRSAHQLPKLLQTLVEAS